MQSKELMQSKLLGHVFRRCSFSLRLFHRCIRMQGQESTSSSKIKLPPMLRTRKKKRIHWPGLKRQGDVSLHKLHIQACTCTVWFCKMHVFGCWVIHVELTDVSFPFISLFPSAESALIDPTIQTTVHSCVHPWTTSHVTGVGKGEGGWRVVEEGLTA